MPNADTQPLFDEAKRLGIGFCLGYAELERADDGRPTAGTCSRWSSATVRSSARTTRSTSPATSTTNPTGRSSTLERYYFEPSPDGFACGGRSAASSG